MKLDRVVARCLLTVFMIAGLLTPALASPADQADEAVRDRSSSTKALQVNINTATENELTRVPGIGKVLARRIVEFRDEHGPFRRLEDLLKVRGIGEKSFQKLRPHLTVGKSR